MNTPSLIGGRPAARPGRPGGADVAARVVDQDVDPAVLGADPGGRRLHRLGPRQVGGDGRRAGPCARHVARHLVEGLAFAEGARRGLGRAVDDEIGAEMAEVFGHHAAEAAEDPVTHAIRPARDVSVMVSIFPRARPGGRAR